MIFDDGERFKQNLAKWAGTDLHAFRFAEWGDDWRWVSRHETAGSIVTTLGVRHDDDRGAGASITVTSHRPDDPQDLRRWVLTNMASQVVRDRADGEGLEPKIWNRRQKQVESDLGNGRVPWAAGAVLIDGQPNACEAVALDAHWGVFAYLLDVHITIVGQHVPLPEFRLVTIDTAPPAIDDPNARMSTGRLIGHVVQRGQAGPKSA